MTPGAEFLTILNLFLTIMLAIGGVFAWKAGFSKTANQVQTSTITAMDSRINTLTGDLNDLRRENHHLLLVLDIIIESLKKRGIEVTIEKTSVTIRDIKDSSMNITRIEEGE